MGQTQSTPDDRAKGMFLVGKPGDSFTFTIENVMDAWEEKNGTPPGDRFAPFMITPDGKHPYKHLVFKGVLEKEVDTGIFSYTFLSVTATEDPTKISGKPTWTGSPSLSDWWMGRFLQSRNRNADGYRMPPSITGGPKGNLVPILMNSQTTDGFRLEGDFSGLKPAQIYKFMNNYATQSLAVVTPSHPFYDDIVTRSKSYTSNAQIRSSFSDIRQNVRGLIGNPKVTLVTEDKTGIVRTETTAMDFLEKPFTAITRGSNKESNYVGVEIDAQADYETDYNNVQNSLDSYWEDVVSARGDEAVMPEVDLEGDVVLDTPDTNIPLVKHTRGEAYKTLLGRVRQLQMAGNRIEAWVQRKQSDGTVHTIFYRRIYPASTNRLVKNSVSGTLHGAKAMGSIEEQVRRVEGLQTTAYKTMLSKDARFSPEKIRQIRNAYIETLAMMVAFQRLNPGEDSLIRSVGVAMGRSSATVDGVNSPVLWRYSQLMAALVRSVDRAVTDKIQRDSGEDDIPHKGMVEGFMSGIGGTASPFHTNHRGFTKNADLDAVTNRSREKLLSALEQNESVVEELAGAYTEASIQFAGMVAAAGVFAAIALLPKSS